MEKCSFAQNGDDLNVNFLICFLVVFFLRIDGLVVCGKCLGNFWGCKRK